MEEYGRLATEEYQRKIEKILNDIRKEGFIAHFTQYDDWSVILIMHPEGRAFCRVFWYHEDNDSIYLNDLSVDEDIRKQGIGTMLQKMRELVGKTLNAKAAYLWVNKDSWQHDWYERRGYFYYADYDNEGTTWMKKDLTVQ